MESGDAILFGVVAALAANSVLFLWPGWDRRRALFYGVQLVNLTVATFLMALGVPSLEGSLAIFNWVLAGLFIVRILTNNKRYNDALRKRRGAQSAATEHKKTALAAALRRGESASRADSGTETPEASGRDSGST